MKHIKTVSIAFGFASLLATAGLIVGCKHMDSDEHSNMHAEKYTCAMHPDVVTSAPGKCPKCGMDLVEKK